MKFYIVTITTDYRTFTQIEQAPDEREAQRNVSAWVLRHERIISMSVNEIYIKEPKK